MPVAMTSDTASRSLGKAVWNGMKLRCPHCGEGHMFRAYLKVADKCEVCGEELHFHRADDFPPYLSIIIVGHVIVGLMLHLEMAYTDVAPWVYMVTMLPAAIVLPLMLIIVPNLMGKPLTGLGAIIFPLGICGLALITPKAFIDNRANARRAGAQNEFTNAMDLSVGSEEAGLGLAGLAYFWLAASLRDGQTWPAVLAGLAGLRGDDAMWVARDAAILGAVGAAVLLGVVVARRLHARSALVRGWVTIGTALLVLLAMFVALD